MAAEELEVLAHPDQSVPEVGQPAPGVDCVLVLGGQVAEVAAVEPNEEIREPEAEQARQAEPRWHAQPALPACAQDLLLLHLLLPLFLCRFRRRPNRLRRTSRTRHATSSSAGGPRLRRRRMRFSSRRLCHIGCITKHDGASEEFARS